MCVTFAGKDFSFAGDYAVNSRSEKGKKKQAWVSPGGKIFFFLFFFPLLFFKKPAPPPPPPDTPTEGEKRERRETNDCPNPREGKR